MTITISIRPEIEAQLARQAAAQGRGVEAYAATLLEEAMQGSKNEPDPPPASTRRTGQSLVDAFAEIRGLLADEEIDQMFSRNSSTARPVDLS